MEKKIFISYSKKNLQEVKDLHKKLKDLGHSLWLDIEDLLPGQNWENEIKKAINNAPVVLVCLSSKWINKRGYVQKELKMVIDAMSRIPEGQTYMIPIKLDECTVPQDLEQVQWLNLYETNAFEKLRKALNFLLTKHADDIEMKDIKTIDASFDFKEFMITHGTLIYPDPWQTAHTTEELEFKKTFKDRLNKSYDYLEIKDYPQIISLWEPLSNNPLFKIDHEEWLDKPYFRCQIHCAKSHLFMAHAQLGPKDFENNVQKAFALIKEVLTGNPYSMKGGSYDTLEVKDAEIQNLNYKEVLEFAQQWFRGWSGKVLNALFKISLDESKNVQERIVQRLFEINYVLNFKDRN